MHNNELKKFFIAALKEKNIKLSNSELEKKFNGFVNWVDKVAIEYFNSPYYMGGGANETKRNN